MPSEFQSRVIFSSVLGVEHREELEALMFFNPHQHRVRERIVASVDRFGKPRVVLGGGACRIAVGRFEDAQTLYALEDGSRRLVGCVVCVRDEPQRLAVVHLAVTEDRVMTEAPAEVPLAVRLVTQVLEIASRIRGVAFVEVGYAGGRFVEFPAVRMEPCDGTDLAPFAQGSAAGSAA